MNLAQTICLQHKFDLRGVLQWRVSDAESLVSSQAWENNIKQKSEIIQAQADMISSVNKTISGAAKSTNETIAKNMAVLNRSFFRQPETGTLPCLVVFCEKIRLSQSHILRETS